MRHQRSGKKLGRDSAHRKALYANLTGALIEHGRIKTTVTKAKAVKPIAEQMITLGRRGDLHARRQAIAFLRSKDVVHKLFAEVAPAVRGAPRRLHADREDRPALRRRGRHGLPRARRLAARLQDARPAEAARPRSPAVERPPRATSRGRARPRRGAGAEEAAARSRGRGRRCAEARGRSSRAEAAEPRPRLRPKRPTPSRRRPRPRPTPRRAPDAK